MKKRQQLFIFLLGLFLVIGLMASGYGLVEEKVLVIKSAEQGTATRFPLPQNRFCLKFTHSVQKTPVYEYYQVAPDNRLVLEATRYYSLGVGLPFTAESGSFTNENGSFLLSGLHREFTTIPLRVSAIPDHAIIVGDKTYPLLSLVRADALIYLSAEEHLVFKKKEGR